MLASRVQVVFVGALLALARADPCEEKCAQVSSEEVDGCKEGCNVYKVVLDAEKFTPEIEDEASTLENCKHSCEDKFPNVASKIEACQTGCGVQQGAIGVAKNKMTTMGAKIVPLTRNNLFDVFFGNNNGFFQPFENDAHRNGPVIGEPEKDSKEEGEANPIGREVTVSFGMPRMFDVMQPDEWGVPTWVHQNMRQMMSNAQKSMAQMMNNMRRNIGESERMAEGRQSGGRMVVIKSGPGYHYEKHYEIGPNGKISEVTSEENEVDSASSEEANDMSKGKDGSSVNNKQNSTSSTAVLQPLPNIKFVRAGNASNWVKEVMEKIAQFVYRRSSPSGSSSSNKNEAEKEQTLPKVVPEPKVDEKDSLAKINPMDESFDEDDVEIFDPELASKKHDNPERQEMIPLIEEIDNAIINQERNSNNKASVYGNDFANFEGPRLPETGLKSRPRPYYHHHPEACNQNGHNMKWSEWVSCLHLKLAMPRWLVTTSLCLGIVFILWLCLVIPRNAPKQRVKKSNVPELSAKEAEALGIVAVTKGNAGPIPNDLPPAYEDLQVNLEPVHKKSLAEEKV